jgi:serine kinase of HPr protein (carbohydrate metabolism regulator)
MLVHGTCVALRQGRGWRGVLLRGPSGAGKSDVALRIIEAGGRLVADDQAHLAKVGARLVATAPRTLSGLIEVRGLGIVKLGPGQLRAQASLALLVDLVPPARVERMPEPAQERILGIDLPRVALAPFEASIVAKLRLALGQAATA